MCPENKNKPRKSNIDFASEAINQLVRDKKSYILLKILLIILIEYIIKKRDIVGFFKLLSNIKY